MVFSYPLSVYFLKFIAGEILWENAARWDVQYNYYVINKKSQAQMANIGRLRYHPTIHTHKHTHTHTNACTNTHARAHTHTHTHACRHTHTHAHTCTHTHKHTGE